MLKDVLFSFRPEESCWWNLLELGGGRYSIPGAIPYPLFSVESDRGSLISEAQRIHVAKPALTLTHSCWFLGACGTVTGNCERGLPGIVLTNKAKIRWVTHILHLT